MRNTFTQLSTLKEVWRYIQRYRRMLFLTILLALASVSLTICIPILVGQSIDHIVGPSDVAFASILPLFVKIGIAVGLTAIFQRLMDITNHKVTCQVVRDIRREAFEKLQVLPLAYIDEHPHGELLSRIVADVDQFSDGLLMGFTQLFTGLMTIVGIIFVMLTINPGITLAVALLTPISLFVANFIAKRTYAMFHLQSAIRADQTALIDEMINGQKVVQAFSREEAAQAAFEEKNEALHDASLRAIFFSSITNPGTRFVNGLVYTAVVLLGALGVISGGLTVGSLSAFLSYVNQYTKPFNEIAGVVAELQNALACAARIFELLHQQEQTPEIEHARTLRDVQGQLTLDHVSFSYTQAKPLLQNISLDVSPGQRIAIVGPTGCGKTTLINLLMRFYDVDKGAIRVEGNDIRDLTRHSLRRSFGMVLQDTWLRDGTVLENIVLGKPDATREEVIAAAKASYAHSFIKRLPNGYDTMIGNHMGELSQGQRQMLCITRIMLCLPPMLILDEATSSIDMRTEVLIQEAFAKLMQGRTSFIVAHRLSTIQAADLILVMRDGNVVEQGTHAQLLEQAGFYAELYNSQYAYV